MEKRIILSTAALLFDPLYSEVLLAKRINALHGNNCYACPGGKMDWGESVEDCIYRETLEEADIILKEFKPLAFVNTTLYEGLGQVVCHWFYAEIFRIEYHHIEKDQQGRPKTEGWKWHKINNLPQPILPGVVKALDHWQRNCLCLTHYPTMVYSW